MSLSSKTENTFPIVVLISGNGSNLQAIIDAFKISESDKDSNQHNTPEKLLPIEIRAVISNRDDAYGLERARKANIETIVVNDKDFSSREDYDKALQGTIDHYQPKLLVLAGFMRILSTPFVMHYLGKIINIHPSLLPKFRGLNTHQRAIDAGETVHGATVHFVTPELDGGPAIVQAKVPVLPDDSADKLAQRVLAQEHQIYPLAIRWIADAKVVFKENQVFFESRILDAPVVYSPEPNNIPEA